MALRMKSKRPISNHSSRRRVSCSPRQLSRIDCSGSIIPTMSNLCFTVPVSTYLHGASSLKLPKPNDAGWGYDLSWYWMHMLRFKPCGRSLLAISESRSSYRAYRMTLWFLTASCASMAEEDLEIRGSAVKKFVLVETYLYSETRLCELLQRAGEPSTFSGSGTCGLRLESFQ